MKKRSIKTAFAFIAILTIVLSSTAVLVTTYVQLTRLLELNVQDHVRDVMDTFQIEVDYDLERAETMASRVAEYDLLIEALESGSVTRIEEVVTRFHDTAAMETDDINVIDMSGNVLYCYQHGDSGTNLAGTETVGAALKGQQMTAVSTGPVIQLGARSAAPVINAAGEQIGVVRVTYSFDDNTLVDELKGDADSEYTVFLGDVRLSTTLKDSSGQRLVGTKMSEKIANTVLTQKQEYIGEAVIQGNTYTSMYRPLLGSDGKAIGALFTGVLTSQIKAKERTALIESVIIAAIAAAIATVCMILYVNRSVVKPVTRLMKDTERLANGDLQVDIVPTGNNEIGTLAQSLRATVESLRGYIGDISENLNAMASRDMTVRVQKDYIGDFAPIKDSLVKIGDSLNDTLSVIQASAEQVSTGSGQVSGGAQALAQGATQQASAVEELAATISDISSKINATAENARTAEQENRVSSQELAVCSGHMNELVAAMKVIDEKSAEISKVIKVIEDIAFQTNILALNAAVEAARAGAAGKGFAVVADEVRNLANKSQEAAKSTTVLIDETVRAVAEGTRLSGATEGSLREVVASAQRVLDAVTLISGATGEQAGAVAQLSSGIDQISSVVQTNSATAEQSAAASQELSGQAGTLRDELSRFKLRGMR